MAGFNRVLLGLTYIYEAGILSRRIGLGKHVTVGRKRRTVLWN